MKHLEHPPAYVAQIGRSWRVVVPIRGRLAAKVCAPQFSTQIGAIAWLQSEEGQHAIALARTTRKAILARAARVAVASQAATAPLPA